MTPIADDLRKGLRDENLAWVNIFFSCEVQFQHMRGSCSPLNISTMRVAPILLLITTAGEESFVTFPIRQAPSPNGCDLKMSRARSASDAAINATNLPSFAR